MTRYTNKELITDLHHILNRYVYFMVLYSLQTSSEAQSTSGRGTNTAQKKSPHLHTRYLNISGQIQMYIFNFTRTHTNKLEFETCFQK